MDRINRKAFFDAYRQAWGPLMQTQIMGLGLLLNALELDATVVDIRHVAYMLATVKHECADTWQPIVERGSPGYFAMYEPGTRRGDALDLGPDGVFSVAGFSRKLSNSDELDGHAYGR